MKKFFIISLSISIMGLIISDAFLRYSNKTFTDTEIQEMFEPITTRYGIRIVYEVGDNFFSDHKYPNIVTGPDPRSKVIPIRHRLLARFPKSLQKAFDKYPDQVIKNNLHAIYFAGEIDQDGLKYGGSYDSFRKIIYVVDSGRQTKKTGQRIFHHEFSSLLFRKYTFPINSWKKCNPKNFKYLYETTENFLATYHGTSSIGTEEDYKDGFMNSYGQTELENDFNAYAGIIFTYPKKFKKIMSTYPRVREKFKIWLEFYHRIDPIFTEEYLLGGEYKKIDK